MKLLLLIPFLFMPMTVWAEDNGGKDGNERTKEDWLRRLTEMGGETWERPDEPQGRDNNPGQASGGDESNGNEGRNGDNDNDKKEHSY